MNIIPVFLCMMFLSSEYAIKAESAFPTPRPQVDNRLQTDWNQFQLGFGTVAGSDDNVLEVVNISFPTSTKPSILIQGDQTTYFAFDVNGNRYSITATPISEDNADLENLVNTLVQAMELSPSIKLLTPILPDPATDSELYGLSMIADDNRISSYFVKSQNFVYILQSVIQDKVFVQSDSNMDIGRLINAIMDQELNMKEMHNSFVVYPIN